MSGSISISVLANTTQLLKGFNKAEGIAKKFTKNMTSMLTGLATGFISYKFVAGIEDSIASLDKLNKTAEKLGTTTEELSSLGYAAELSGIKMNAFEMSTQRMTRRVAEAAQGIGEAQGALKDLGIDAETLNQMTLEDKMGVLADSFKNVEDGSEKLRLAFKLFDSGGTQMITMLNGGSESLQRMQSESDKLGKTIKQSLADEASRAADSMTAFSGALDGMTNNMLSSFLPTLNKAFFAMMDFFDIPRQKGLEELNNQLADLEARLIGARKIFADPSILDIFDAGALDSTKIGIANLNTAIETTKTKIAELQNQTATEPLFSNGLIESASKFATILDSLQSRLDPYGTQVKKYTVDIENLDKALASGAITQSDYNTMMQNLNGSMPGVSSDFKDLENGIGDVDQAAQRANTTFASGMTSAFRQAMDGATSFGALFENVAKDIVAQLIHILVVQKAVNAAMAGMGFTTAASGGGGGASPQTTSIDGGLASGGTLKSPGTYMVGEKGPELLSLPAGANVTPNGGHAKSEINIYNYGNDRVRVEEDEAGKIDIIIDVIANQIAQGTGNLGTSFENRYNLSKS